MPLSLLGRSKSTKTRSPLSASSTSSRGRKEAAPLFSSPSKPSKPSRPSEPSRPSRPTRPRSSNRSSGSNFLRPPSPVSSGRRSRSYETSSRRPRPASPPTWRDGRPEPPSRRDSRRPGRSVSPRPRPVSPRRAARVPPRRPRRDSSISDDSRSGSRRPSLSPPRVHADRLASPKPDYRRSSLSPSRFPTERALRQEPPLSTHQRPVRPSPPRATPTIPTAAHPHPAKPVRPSPLAGSRTSSYEYDSIPHVMHSSVGGSGPTTPPLNRPRMHERASSARSSASHSRDHSPRPSRPLYGEVIDEHPRKEERASRPPLSPRQHSARPLSPKPRSPRSEHPPQPEHAAKADHEGKPGPSGKPAPKPAEAASPKHSPKPSSKGRNFWGKIPEAFGTFAGLEALTQHADNAKEWTDWLKNIRDAPDEMHGLSAKAQTAKDTITQIQNTLEARPDLVEGESGRRLRDQIEDAIKSTNGVLKKQTEMLQELGETTAGDDSILSGLQEFYNSYKYRTEWEPKIKEADEALQSELSSLSTLMINLYSRAMMKPPPAGTSNNVPPPAPVPESSKNEETRAADPASGKKTAPTSDEKPSSSSADKDTDERAEQTISPTSAGFEPPPMPQMPKDTPGSRSIPTSSDERKKENEGPNTKARDTASTAPPTDSTTNAGTNANEEPKADTRPAGGKSKGSDPLDEDAEEALLDAAWNGDVEAAEEASRYTPVTICDSKGYTPLHLAAERDNLAIAMLLLDRGADVNARSKGGRMPLHLAARYASADTVELLVDDGHADINARTTDGRTPLHYAASSAADGDEERREVVRVLRDWGADPTIVDSKGMTPRECAQKRDFWDVSSTLRRAEKKWEEEHPQSWFKKHGFRK